MFVAQRLDMRCAPYGFCLIRKISMLNVYRLSFCFPIGNYILHILCWLILVVVNELCVYVFMSMFLLQLGKCMFS